MPAPRSVSYLVWAAILLAPGAVLMQRHTARVPFLLDDLTAVALLHPAGSMDSGCALAVLWPTDPAFRFHGHFRPLGWASIILDQALLGPNPSRIRAIGILIHALAALLVGLAALKLFGGTGILPALGAALYFFLYPGSVEPVVWVAHRFTLLSALFWLLLLLSCLRYGRLGRGALWIPLVTVLALLSKDSALSQVWVAAAGAPLLAPGGQRLHRLGRTLLLVGMAWSLMLILRYLAVGALLPSFGEGGNVVAAFHPLERLMELPGVLLLALAPVAHAGLAGYLATGILLGCAGFLLLQSFKGPGRLGAWRSLLLFVLLLLAALPVLGIGPDLDGSRRLYLPAMALSLLLSAGLQGRSPWLLAVLLLPLLLPLWWREQAYLQGAEIITQVTSEVERAAAGGAQVRVGGLPATFKGSPLFGPRAEHLPVRFKAPLHVPSLDVKGYARDRWPQVLDHILGITRIVLFHSPPPGPATRLAVSEMWQVGGPAQARLAGTLHLLSPPAGASWSGERLKLLPPPGGWPPNGRLLLTLGNQARLVVALPAKDLDPRAAVRLPLKAKTLLLASPGVSRLLTAARQGPIKLRLQARLIAPLGCASLGASTAPQTNILELRHE